VIGSVFLFLYANALAKIDEIIKSQLIESNEVTDTFKNEVKVVSRISVINPGDTSEKDEFWEKDKISITMKEPTVLTGESEIKKDPDNNMSLRTRFSSDFYYKDILNGDLNK
jgi:hypothetical protein